MFHSRDIQFFVFLTIMFYQILTMFYQICGVIMNISAGDSAFLNKSFEPQPINSPNSVS